MMHLALLIVLMRLPQALLRIYLLYAATNSKKLQVLGNALNHPARPFVAILGGAKCPIKLE